MSPGPYSASCLALWLGWFLATFPLCLESDRRVMGAGAVSGACVCLCRQVGEHQRVDMGGRQAHLGGLVWGTFLLPGGGMLFLAFAQGQHFNIYLS